MSRLALHPDRVFDSIRGQMIENVAVVIGDGSVQEITSPANVADSIRLPGTTLLPGLIDAHTHVAGPLDTGQGYGWTLQRTGAQDALVGVKNALTTIKAGFTTVRDVGTWRAFTDVALRDAIDDGWVIGPRMMVAGAYLTSPGGAGDITGLASDVDEVLPRELRFGVTTGVDGMRSTVRQILRYGADLIKVLATGAVLTSGTNPGAPEMTEDELRAVVETAGEAGAHVAAHAHGAEGIKRAVRAGVRSIEHGSLADDEAIALMAESGTYLVADLYDGDYIAETGPDRGYTAEVLRKNAMTADAQRSMFHKAVEAGVRIAFGTDAGVYPHGDNAKQLAYYARHGLTAAQALQSATRWAAEMIGWESEVGAIDPGMRADLIVVDGNPLDDLAVMTRVQGVMKDGDWVVSPVPRLEA